MARLLENMAGPAAPPTVKPLPDWPHVHQELRPWGVTLRLLWQEDRQVDLEVYGNRRFCELYERWSCTLDLVLR